MPHSSRFLPRFLFSDGGAGSSAGAGDKAGSAGAGSSAGAGDKAGSAGAGSSAGAGDKAGSAGAGSSAGAGDKAGSAGAGSSAGAGDKAGSASKPAPGSDQVDDQASPVQDLQAKIEALQAEMSSLTEKQNKSEAQEHQRITQDVARKAGIPESMASRLVGSTREELEADAVAMATGLGSRVIDPTQGTGPSGRRRAPSLAEAALAKIKTSGLK